jgi:hypothetical protein
VFLLIDNSVRTCWAESALAIPGGNNTTVKFWDNKGAVELADWIQIFKIELVKMVIYI